MLLEVEVVVVEVLVEVLEEVVEVVEVLLEVEVLVDGVVLLVVVEVVVEGLKKPVVIVPEGVISVTLMEYSFPTNCAGTATSTELGVKAQGTAGEEP